MECQTVTGFAGVRGSGMTVAARVDLAGMIIIVAGVSGSGKTTVSALLARQLHWPFADGDAFHLAAAIGKMRAGIPLTDADRWPWLRAIAAWMDEHIAQDKSAVICCSALKRCYRDFLLDGRPEARMVFLAVDRDVLVRRLADRHGHFFPAQLLNSQFDALEPPQPDEHAVIVVEHAEDRPADTVAKIIGLLRLGDTVAPRPSGGKHEAET
jgi:gluconokinase